MKVLWITNGLFAHHFSLLNQEPKLSASGSWLYAAYEAAKNSADIELHIATVSNRKDMLNGKYEGVSFYILPGGSIFDYDLESQANQNYWKELAENIKPDILVSWGSEARFAYLAFKCFSNNTPKVIYVQGVMNAIVGHLDDGVPHKVLCSTLRDYVDKLNPKKKDKLFYNQTEIEKKLFKLADAAIVENDWCESQCKAMNPKIGVFYNKLPIKKDFYNCSWNIDKIDELSIFTNAGGVTYKGHHILFQALSIVKKTFPKVKLYIPGDNYLLHTKGFIHRTGYYNWLHRIYNNNSLHENIIFTGVLSSQQMAERLAKSNLYVMPSMVENHSSSLIEALIVGVPCISSMVGGAASLVHHGEDALLYNSREHETLAGYIIKLLGDKEMCKLLGKQALNIRENRRTDFGQEMFSIYKSILG
ncbi:glycosyltransferase [uncultured Bacteroides sp.]|uniref:glycosyltransferase family 4 protein n=1 Tax=uncultured Bacteroides sp. TaxID=162156 RepID=UPI002AA871B4|nr:glycosyltransferase [uncultured Bacteroides sp.]